MLSSSRFTHATWFFYRLLPLLCWLIGILILASCHRDNSQNSPFFDLTRSNPSVAGSISHYHQMGKQHLNVNAFGPNQGFFAKSVMHSYVDKSGLLWLGTENGLFSYNGYTFTNYTNKNDVPFPIYEKEIGQIQEDEKGNIIFMTGLANIISLNKATGKHKYIYKSEKSPGVSQWYNFVYQKNQLWSYGMSTPILMDGTPIGQELFDSSRLDYVTPGHNGEMIVLAYDYTKKMRVLCKISSDLKHRQDAEENVNLLIKSRFSQFTGAVLGNYPYLFLCGQKGGVAVLNQETMEFHSLVCGEKDLSSIWGTKKSIHFNKEANMLYVGCWSGTILQIQLDQQGRCQEYFSFKKHLYDQHNFTSGPILTISEDEFNNIWVGTYLDGLFKLSRKSGGVELLSKENGVLSDIQEDNITSLCWMDSLLHIGTQNGYYIYNQTQNTVRHLEVPKTIGRQSDWITDIVPDPINGYLVISSYGGGLYFYQKGAERLLSPSEAGYLLDSNFPNGIFIQDLDQRDGFIHTSIYGTAELVVNLEDKTVKKIHLGQHGLKGSVTHPISALNYSVSIDHEGNVWRSNSDHYTVTKIKWNENYDFQNITEEDLKTQFSVEEYCLGREEKFCEVVEVVFVDYKGRVLAGTHRGVFMYDPYRNIFENITIENYDADYYVQSLYNDDYGNLWIGTLDGVLVLDTSLTKLEKSFNAEDGYDLQNRQFNRNAICIDAGANMYLGGVNGVNRFTYNIVPLLDKDAQVSFLSMEANSGEKMIHKIDEKVKIGQGEFPIVIKVFSSDYTKPKYTQYAYYIEGVDKQYQLKRGDNAIHLSQLPEGDYRIMATSKGVNSGWSQNYAELTLNVVPLWYKSRWFRSLLLLFGIGVLFIFFRALQKRREIQKDNELKLRLLKIQTLQSQMNPHFIFNVLGRIQNLILSGNPKLANQHLIKLSKLMRGFLDVSVVSNDLNSEEGDGFITLQKEIELLTMYVDFEHLKYRDEFDYKISHDPNIDLYAQHVPGMILQPFVENAIKHGLLYKDNKGRLSIYFKKTERGVLVTIEDDGVGRQKAAEIQSASIKSYKSRGTDLIKERIQLMNEVGYEIKVETTDRPGGGTIVQVWFED